MFLQPLIPGPVNIPTNQYLAGSGQMLEETRLLATGVQEPKSASGTAVASPARQLAYR